MQTFLNCLFFFILMKLTPDDKIIHKEWEKDMKEAKEYVRKLSIISTKEKDKEEPVEEKENVQEKVHEPFCSTWESHIYSMPFYHCHPFCSTWESHIYSMPFYHCHMLVGASLRVLPHWEEWHAVVVIQLSVK